MSVLSYGIFVYLIGALSCSIAIILLSHLVPISFWRSEQNEEDSYALKYQHMFTPVHMIDEMVEEHRKMAIEVVHDMTLLNYGFGTNANNGSERGGFFHSKHNNACCRSTPKILTPKTASLVYGGTEVTLVQPGKFKQIFVTEDCQCENVWTISMALVYRDGDFPFVAPIKHRGCCKCINFGENYNE